MERVEVSILDRSLTLSVDSSEREKLIASVKHADQLMQQIKAASPSLSPERIAIMASIKLASDLMSMESGDGPFKGVQFGEFQSKINDINALLDQSIDELKSI
ncbi:cell division protein ZapA [Pelistega indica]|uniref:Cell division protein ZapA n=1 Tax=Pelistega indica TaxID=1414851 RepID=V8G8W1_9BURK|nr:MULTISPECIES: cell division protein ZapA [Pelistega]ETD72403.1 cell division protein ZapA [Pelistega indica]